MATIGLAAATGAEAPASPFVLNIREDASEAEVETTLRAERAHRRLYPDDEIVIALPSHLFRSAPIVLGPEDSGRETAPLVLRGAGDGATVSGAVAVGSQFPADLPEALRARLPAAVRDQVRRARLSDALLAITAPPFAAIGSFAQAAPGRLVVFEGDRRLQPARWPPEGYLTSPDVSAGSAPDRLAMRLPAPVAGLEREAVLWVDGFWGWNWWFERRGAHAISEQTFDMAKPEAPIRPGARYRLVNVAAGLDRSGVVYWDGADGALDFLPDPSDRDGRLFIAIADGLLRVREAAHVRIENVAFEKTIGSAVSIDDSSDVVLRDCYVGETGTNGIVISGGDHDRVERCVVDDIGYAGVSIAGGDRTRLAGAGHVLRATSVSRFGRELPSYRPGVSLQGVGNRVEDCEIAFGPHAGLIVDGNDHVIEGNVLHDVALDSDDSGAIYADRSWTARGTIIAANEFRDIRSRVSASPVMGVYLDDQISGVTVEGNVFQRVDEPILVGGGRDNVVRDNLLLGSRRGPIALDARGLSWEAHMASPSGVLTKGLETVPVRSAIWATRYPALARLPEDHPGAPIGNRFADNLADRAPLVVYDRPQTAAFGRETGDRTIDARGVDFPSLLAGLPPDAPATPVLRATADRIAATERSMQALRFRRRRGE